MTLSRGDMATGDAGSTGDAGQDLDPGLLEILVCPVSRGRLFYDRAAGELVSDQARLAFPVRNGVPILLAEEARDLDAPEGPLA